MLVIHLQKFVTLSKDLTGGKSVMWDCKYKDLGKELSNVNELTATYPYGSRGRRIKNLEKLGFKLKETIWLNDDAPHSNCREVWAR